MISLEAVTVDYASGRPLHDLNLHLPAGTTAAIMGPSGSGKSTLLRLIAGLQAPTAGRVRIEGTAVTLATWRTASDARVALIHQDHRLVPFLTVADNLLLAAEMRGLRRSESDAAAVLAEVALPAAMLTRLPLTLSGGEQQRVGIARCLLVDARVILADEPTGALDEDNTTRIADLLVNLGRSKGRVVIVATHDHEVAARFDTCLRLERGQVAVAA